MNETTNLHWSFSHDGEAQSPQFGQQLRSLVKDALEETADGEPAEARTLGEQVTRYTILPNFRRGHKLRPCDTEEVDDLAVGEVVVRRMAEGENCLNYSVGYRNVASGEILDLKFSSNTDAFRTLTGTWSVQVENFAGDGSKGFACDGRQEKDGTVFLTTNGLDLRAGSADLAVPLTCNWTLFDVIPALANGLRESREVQRLLNWGKRIREYWDEHPELEEMRITVSRFVRLRNLQT